MKVLFAMVSGAGFALAAVPSDAEPLGVYAGVVAALASIDYIVNGGRK